MAKQETTIQLRASDRFKRLVEARATGMGLTTTAYIKQQVLASDEVLRTWLWSDAPTDDLVQVPIKQTQKASE